MISTLSPIDHFIHHRCQSAYFRPRHIMSTTPAPSSSEPSNTHWRKPSYTLPVPSLKFLLHLECDMEDRLVGSGRFYSPHLDPSRFLNIGPGPYGDRKAIMFKGGRFEGPDGLHGEILPGGGGEYLPDDDSSDCPFFAERYTHLSIYLPY